jgi:HK97 family phage portal protein
MGKIKDLFFKQQSSPRVVVYSSPERRPGQYVLKEDRAESITYAGIGQTKYSGGYPPTFYDIPVAAIRAYPVVYAVITAISEAMSGLGIKIFEVQGGQRVEVEDHPFYDMFARPNPWQGSFEFIEQVQQSLDVCGNVFISKEKVAGSYEFYVLNAKYVAIIPDPTTKVREYRYNINGKSIPYKPEEIVHIKYNDIDDPYYGMPPLATATEILAFEKNRLKFANNYFLNGAIPVGVLETEQILGETLLKKLRTEWTQIHQGVGNSHKVGILQGGLKYRPITSPIKDLDFSGLKKMSKEDILAIFKVPESILGSQAGTGAKEGRDAITSFWRQCIIPRLKRIESGMNRGLSIDVFGGGKYVFEFNLKEVAALADDKTEIADYLQKMVSSSIYTINEARAVVGLPKSDEEYADQLLISNSVFGNALMPVSEIGAQGAGSTKPKPGTSPSGSAPVKPKAKPPKAKE